MIPGPSIRRQVLTWTMSAFFLGASLFMAAAWWVIHHELDEVFEDNLKQVALAVAQHRGPLVGRPRLTQELPRVFEEYGQFEFVTAVWNRQGQLIDSSEPNVVLPFLSRSGISQVRAAGESWHLYTVVLEDGMVQAAQRTRERDALARESLFELAGPALGMLLMVGLMLAWALQRGLRPLSQAADQVADRRAGSLHPLPLASQPQELQPLVAAINDLMTRLDEALATQSRFLADAAHELRTPITALRLQIQWAERAPDDEKRNAALAELRSGIDRAQHMIESLLELSRLGPQGAPLLRRPVDLAALVRECVVRWNARAEALGISLAAVTQATPPIQGDSQQLAALLDNLVDNALRHGMRTGHVDVAVTQEGQQVCLVVTDNGPGIAPAERERVLDRFYRGSTSSGYGSGLGLAIVKGVADQHAAVLTLHDAPGGGLQVRVSFPTV